MGLVSSSALLDNNSIRTQQSLNRNQNWERSDQLKAQLRKNCSLIILSPTFCGEPLAGRCAPVLILREPRCIFWSGKIHPSSHPNENHDKIASVPKSKSNRWKEKRK